MRVQVGKRGYLAGVRGRHTTTPPADDAGVMSAYRSRDRSHTAGKPDDFGHLHAPMWGSPTSGVKIKVGSSRPDHLTAVENDGMSESSSLADRVRTLREQRQMTQAALGAEIGISRSHLTKIERGDDAPGRVTLMAMATYFDVSLDWLAEGRGDKRPAKATSDQEAILLYAFRQLPPDEAEAHLNLILKRVNTPSS